MTVIRGVDGKGTSLTAVRTGDRGIRARIAVAVLTYINWLLKSRKRYPPGVVSAMISSPAIGYSASSGVRDVIAEAIS